MVGSEKAFLYLFDYGDEWEFKVDVEEINSDKPLPLTPRIVGKRGEAPDQYKQLEDDNGSHYYKRK